MVRSISTHYIKTLTEKQTIKILFKVLSWADVLVLNNIGLPVSPAYSVKVLVFYRGVWGMMK